ncbi:MAG: amino acid permease [Spirochaetales bacterium]|nr:amino acid permease [Spirochaetales bacterium]
MEKPNKVSYELSRDLSLFQLTMMGMGMMIGAGVFLGIGHAIFEAGPGGAILTFALNTVLAMCTAMSYAELSSAIPRAGGAYNFARIGFGRQTSFLAGWMEWFASSIAGSMYAIVFSIYTVRYFGELGFLFWLPEAWLLPFERALAVVIALFFIYINYRGVSETGIIGAIMTLGQTLFLVFIGLAGLYVAFTNPERIMNFKPFMPKGWHKLLITMGFTYVAFEGFEVISQAGDEAKEPRKNLPKAMLYSVFSVGIIYVLVSFAAIIGVKAGSQGVSMAPWEWIGSHGDKGFAEAVSRLIPLGSFLLTLAVIFASTSALNATIFSATRASYALGRDKMLPKFFSKISMKRKTPVMALLATGTIILINVIFLPTKDVASSASIMFLFLFFLVNICVIRIRLNMGEELLYGFIMPLFPLFPVLGLVVQVILAVFLIHMSFIAWIIAPCWIIAGLIIYNLYSKTRVTPHESEIIVIEEKDESENEQVSNEYRVLVPVANPKNAISLVGNTIKICRDKNASIQLLHMVEVPDLFELRDAEKYILEGKEGIVEAMLYLMPSFPIKTTIRHCRNTARGIVSAIREKRINLIIMGWHGNRKDKKFFMGSTLDHVIGRSPCNIVILKDCNKRKFLNILVPVFSPKDDPFALEIAGRLVSPEGKISVLPINGKEKVSSSRKFAANNANNIKGQNIKMIKPETAVNSKNILETVEEYDLIVMSTVRKRSFYKIGGLSPQEAIIRYSDKPIAFVQSAKGITAITKMWF